MTDFVLRRTTGVGAVLGNTHGDDTLCHSAVTPVLITPAPVQFSTTGLNPVVLPFSPQGNQFIVRRLPPLLPAPPPGLRAAPALDPGTTLGGIHVQTLGGTPPGTQGHVLVYSAAEFQVRRLNGSGSRVGSLAGDALRGRSPLRVQFVGAGVDPAILVTPQALVACVRSAGLWSPVVRSQGLWQDPEVSTGLWEEAA
jgi:hypothetical protein